MNFIASLEPHVIMYILSSISEGLTALGNYYCSLLCSLGFDLEVGKDFDYLYFRVTDELRPYEWVEEFHLG